MYLLNWVWRAIFETGYRQWIVWLAGLVQTGLYADFFYYYYKRFVGSSVCVSESHANLLQQLGCWWPIQLALGGWRAVNAAGREMGLGRWENTTNQFI
jgi:hypothetical protein